MVKKYLDLNEKVLTSGDIIDIHQTVNGTSTFVVFFKGEELFIEYWIGNQPCRDYEYDKEDLLSVCKYEGVTDWEIIDNIKNHDLTLADLYPLKPLKNNNSEIQKLRGSISKYRGHKIIYIYDTWVFLDSKTPVENNKNIKCGHCSKPSTKEGHDSCLGSLPGLMNACCGHGSIEETYIQFLDGSCVRGNNARIIIGVLQAAKHE